MPYSEGVAPYYDLFGTPDNPLDEAAEFLMPLLQPDATVLDVGAGTGTTAFALAQRGVFVTALEPDAEMYAAMLTRLGSRSDIADRVSPIPQAAGFSLEARFDVCASFAVLHLLTDEEQHVLARYVAAQLKPGGVAVLEIPVVSSQRSPRPWSVTATRTFGRVRIEHHTQMECKDTGDWITRWRFVSYLDHRIVNEVDKAFHWRPLTHGRSESVLGNSGLEVVDEFAGYDRVPYVPGDSRVRLVVAQACSQQSREIR
ncbi:MAG TPA: class I SAM-dependent methyltransferase [Casimicrobiaceae bacterium]|nr:class I SAM-dependent methyltransferase [Casimicrobiaceae bacterium]